MTPVDGERHRKILANAEHGVDVMSEARGEPVGFDLDSIGWVEGFVERSRQYYAPDSIPPGFTACVGCYLGEAIISEAGGVWADDEALGGPGVVFPNGDMVFPVAKVAKQLEQGVDGGESILSFYTVAGPTSQPAPSARSSRLV